MFKILILGFIIWLIIFSFRVISIGGLDPTYRDSESRVLEPFRESLIRVIDQGLPYPQAPLLAGILLGAQKQLPFGLKEDLKTTATIHMVVVSGQNLSILAGFILVLAPYIGRRKAVLLSLPVIFFYSLLTGFQVPVIRAAVMVILASLGQLLGKEGVGWWVLLLTAALMLLYNPNWLLSISFQLSFLATFAVVVVAPILSTSLWFVPKILREDLAVTLGAQALTLPIIAYNFGQISLVGVLANVFTIWIMPAVMISGFITLLLGSISLFLGIVVGLIPGVLLTYFVYIVQFFASLPLSSLRIGETGWVMWVGYYLMTCSFIVWLRMKQDKVN